MSVHLNKLPLGRRADATDAYEEALRIHRKLMANNPAAFALKHAFLLRNYAQHLRRGHQWSEALTCIKESVDIYRDLAQKSLVSSEVQSVFEEGPPTSRKMPQNRRGKRFRRLGR